MRVRDWSSYVCSSDLQTMLNSHAVGRLVEQTAQYILHDAPVAVVGGLAGRIDAHLRLELDVARLDLDGFGYVTAIQARNTNNVERFFARQTRSDKRR